MSVLAKISRIALAPILGLAGTLGVAFAQGSPGLIPGQIVTDGTGRLTNNTALQWNGYFATKQNYSPTLTALASLTPTAGCQFPMFTGGSTPPSVLGSFGSGLGCNPTTGVVTVTGTGTYTLVNISTGTTYTLPNSTIAATWMSASVGVKTLTLPSCSGSNPGEIHLVTDGEGNAITYNIDVVPGSMSTIAGLSVFVMEHNSEATAVMCDGISNWQVWNDDWPGSGTVTSVGLALPASTFTVTVSPITDSGSLTATFANQNANTFLAGPSSGGATTPAWRALVAADLPLPTTSAVGGVEAINAVSHQWINSINGSGVPQLSQPQFTDINGTAQVGQGGTGQTSLISNAFLTGNGTSGINQVAITGLVLGNGASAPTAYAGASCTNQALTALSASGAATCNSITNAFLTAGTFSNITGVGTVTTGTWSANIGGAGGATLNGNVNFNSQTVTGNGTFSGNLTFSGANNYGTPAALALTNATGLPLTTGVTGFGSGVTSALSANLPSLLLPGGLPVAQGVGCPTSQTSNPSLPGFLNTTSNWCTNVDTWLNSAADPTASLGIGLSGSTTTGDTITISFATSSPLAKPSFTGAGNSTTTLTVSGFPAGYAGLGVGTNISGTGIPANTYITVPGTGTGGNGTYTTNHTLSISGTTTVSVTGWTFPYTVTSGVTTLPQLASALSAIINANPAFFTPPSGGFQAGAIVGFGINSGTAQTGGVAGLQGDYNGQYLLQWEYTVSGAATEVLSSIQGWVGGPVFNGGTGGGTANAQTATASSFDGNVGSSVSFIAGATNTNAATLNVSYASTSTGAIAVVKTSNSDFSLHALTGGEIVSGATVMATYAPACYGYNSGVPCFILAIGAAPLPPSNNAQNTLYTMPTEWDSSMMDAKSRVSGSSAIAPQNNAAPAPGSYMWTLFNVCQGNGNGSSPLGTYSGNTNCGEIEALSLGAGRSAWLFATQQGSSWQIGNGIYSGGCTLNVWAGCPFIDEGVNTINLDSYFSNNKKVLEYGTVNGAQLGGAGGSTYASSLLNDSGTVACGVLTGTTELFCNSVLSSIIIGGTAAGSTLTVEATSNGSPSGDAIDIKAHTANFLSGATTFASINSNGVVVPNGSFVFGFNNSSAALDAFINESSGNILQITTGANGEFNLRNGANSNASIMDFGINAANDLTVTASMILKAQPTLASSTTGSGTQTFTNSPCSGLTSEKWIPVSITGQSGTWYVPACQ